MNIGEAATRSGVPAKTIRYYEDVGLIRAAPRTGNGYRAYDQRDVHVLRFVQRARSLGFSVSECHRLLDLYRDPHRTSAQVKALTLGRIAELDRKMAELAGMRATLVRLAESCQGDDRPDCPIIENLAQPEAPEKASRSCGPGSSSAAETPVGRRAGGSSRTLSGPGPPPRSHRP